MVDMSVEGPPHETEYYLSQDQVERSKYHNIARSLTRCVLDVHPRRVSEIRLMGTIPVLDGVDDEALETLREGGVTVTDERLDGRIVASDGIIDAVLSLYAPGLHHAHFFDSDGYGIAARYDDTFQHYWLSASAYPTVKRRLDPTVLDALLTIDELEEVDDCERTDNDN